MLTNYTKPEFEALDEGVRTFLLEGGRYKLNAGGTSYEFQTAELGQLKGTLKSRESELASMNTELAEERRKSGLFDGIDPAAARAALKQADDLAKERLQTPGDFQKALEAETETFSKRLEAETAKLEVERRYTSKTLIDDGMRRALTSPGHVVDPGLIDALEANLLRNHKPVVVDKGESGRMAVAKIDGRERDFTDWIKNEFLESDAAKPFLLAENNSGGHGDDQVRTGGSGSGNGKVIMVSSADKSKHIEGIAKGTHQVAAD